MNLAKAQEAVSAYAMILFVDNTEGIIVTCSNQDTCTCMWCLGRELSNDVMIAVLIFQRLVSDVAATARYKGTKRYEMVNDLIREATHELRERCGATFLYEEQVAHEIKAEMKRMREANWSQYEDYMSEYSDFGLAA